MLAFDHAGKLFIWCDHNDDGKYQVEEVELFDAASKPDLLRGLTVAPDLSLWGNHWRVKPSQITAAGVPVYRAADFTPFHYDALHYSRNYTLGGPKSAKPGYSGFKYVSTDGALYQEGQPFVVLRDGTIKGGMPETKPSDYVPLIDGLVPQTTFQVCGGAKTKSAVGEVVVVNSNNGYWYVWAVDYGVCIGTFFTGETGGWGMPVQRDLDVTGRKQEWEGWGGHFLRADNGQYFATAGKGFHGISRVEGLDNYKVQTFPLRVTAEQAKLSQQLRPVLKGRYDAVGFANGKETRKELIAAEFGKRTKNFKLDGQLEDWGARHAFRNIGPAQDRLVFDAAQDERGLFVAVSGEGKVAGKRDDWKQAYRAGFAFDLQFRTNAKSRARDTVAGDRRLIIARQGAEWIAVLYEYEGDGVVLNSPVATTKIGKITN